MNKISIAIPNFNRTTLLVEAFQNIIEDNRINEIVICDDASKNFEEVKDVLKSYSKVNLIKNEVNFGTFFNKLRTIQSVSNEWCVLLDSDNIIDKSYIDNICATEWKQNRIVCPQKLLHHPQNSLGIKDPVFFDYSEHVEKQLDLKYCATNFDRYQISTLMNTGNYFVNRNQYIKSFEKNSFNRNVDIADVAFFNYLFLKEDVSNHLYVSKELAYVHRVHPGSFYLNNSHLSSRANNFLRELLKKEIS